MPSHKRTISVVSDRLEITEVTTVSPETEVKFEVIVPDSTTDGSYSVFVENTNLKSFVLMSTQDVTVETNNATTPDETFSLTANDPYIWFDGDGASPIGGDVTVIYVTNASGSDATLQLLAGWTFS